MSTMHGHRVFSVKVCGYQRIYIALTKAWVGMQFLHMKAGIAGQIQNWMKMLTSESVFWILKRIKEDKYKLLGVAANGNGIKKTVGWRLAIDAPQTKTNTKRRFWNNGFQDRRPVRYRSISCALQGCCSRYSCRKILVTLFRICSAFPVQIAALLHRGASPLPLRRVHVRILKNRKSLENQSVKMTFDFERPLLLIKFSIACSNKSNAVFCSRTRFLRISDNENENFIGKSRKEFLAPLTRMDDP